MKQNKSKAIFPLNKQIIVDTSIAKRFGLNEAIIIQQIHYWITLNKKENKFLFDARFWTPISYISWHQQLPFWSIRTIKRIINGLEQKEIVISTDTYNKKPTDKTKWYTLNYLMISP